MKDFQPIPRREFLKGIAIAPIGIFAACSESSEEAHLNTFNSVNFPYQINYPQDWFSSSLSAEPGQKLDIFKPEFEGRFISVDSKVNSASLSLDEALTESVDSTIRDLNTLGILPEANVVSAPGRRDKYGLNKVGEEKYDAYRYEVDLGEQVIEAVVFLAENRIWYAVLTCKMEEKDKYLKTLQIMMRSFKVNKKENKT